MFCSAVNNMGVIKNLDKINYRKRDSVKRGLEFIDEKNKNNPVIWRVVIFGSAIREDCRKKSDIDICFFSDHSCRTSDIYSEIFCYLGLVMDENLDIFNYSKVSNSSLKSNIDKGVVVYEY